MRAHVFDGSVDFYQARWWWHGRLTGRKPPTPTKTQSNDYQRSRHVSTAALRNVHLLVVLGWLQLQRIKAQSEAPLPGWPTGSSLNASYCHFLKCHSNKPLPGWQTLVLLSRCGFLCVVWENLTPNAFMVTCDYRMLFWQQTVSCWNDVLWFSSSRQHAARPTVCWTF